MRIVSDGPGLAVTTYMQFRGSPAGHGFEGQPAVPAAAVLMAPLVHVAADYGMGLPVLTSRIALHNPGQARIDVNIEYVGFAGSCAGQRYAQGPISVEPGFSTLIDPASPEAGGPPAGCSASAVLTARSGGILAVVLDEGVESLPPTAAPTSSRVSPTPTATRTEPPTATATEVHSGTRAFLPYCEKPSREAAAALASRGS
jgi:hypothetical protein